MDRINVEELLAQKDYVHSLARSLVHDENAANDIAQQALLAAWETSPSSVRSVRGWLRGTVRNLFRFGLRGEARRRDREASVARQIAVPSTADTVANDELRRLLVEAVVELDEPYRSSVQLRYFAELSPRQIAAKTGITLETVRTRLKRGLAKLRERLDREFGERGSWCLALAPLAGVKVGGVVTAGSAVSAVGKVSGGILMASKVKVGLVAAVVVVIVAAFSIWQAWPEMPSDKEPFVSGLQTDNTEQNGRNASKTENIDIAALPSERVKVPVIATHFSGRVFNKVTGEPITSYHIWIKAESQEGRDDTTNLHETIHDAEGEFLIALEHGGKYRVSFRSADHIRSKLFGIDIPNGAGLHNFEVFLDPGQAISGIVRDFNKGNPIAEAVIFPKYTWPKKDRLLFVEGGYDEYCVHAITNEQGLFEIHGLSPSEEMIVALHPEYTEGIGRLSESVGGFLEITLSKKGYRIYGKVYDDSGSPVAGVAIRTEEEQRMPVARTVLTTVDGSYITPPIPRGTVSLHAEPPLWERSGSLDFTEEWKLVSVVDKNVEVNFGAPGNTTTWRGKLRFESGEPVPNGRIEIKLASVLIQWNDFEGGYRRINCDEKGQFSAKKLIRGQYDVSVDSSCFSSLDWGTISLNTTGVIDKDVVIEKGMIRGLIINGQTGEALEGVGGEIRVKNNTIRDGSSNYEIRTDGSFELKGLKRGIYSIHVTPEGYPSKTIDGIRFPPLSDSDYLRIPVNPGGTLCIEFKGFPSDYARGIRFAFVEDGLLSQELSNNWEMQWIGECGEMTRFCESGQGTLMVFMKDGRYIERRYKVVSGQTTKICISAAEAVSSDNLTEEVVGVLKKQNGKPIGDLRICFRIFSPLQSPFGIPREIETTTDEFGIFAVNGLCGGDRVAAITIDEEHKLYLPFSVKYNETDSVELELIVSDANVKGECIDAATGNPLSWQCSVCIIDITTGQHAAYYRSPGIESHAFMFRGLPTGDYIMRINSNAYKEYFTSQFRVETRGTVDFGRIPLEPKGILRLRVKNSKGQPIEVYRVEWLTAILKKPTPKYVSSGCYNYVGLPFGTILFRVSADGYESKEVTAAVETFSYNDETVVVLQRKP